MRIFEPRALAIGKRLLLAIIAVAVVLGLVSAHRAWFQVREVALQGDRTLRAGSRVHAAIVTSGRTFVDVEVRLIQGHRSEVIGTLEVPRNTAVYDFRKQRWGLTVTLDGAVLRRFAPGNAVVRATAFGAAQWMRVPPPVVSDLPVVIERSHGA
jgi:hypothetical protein